MSSVVTDLVTSLEFQSIRCANRLCHFGRERNDYVATRFILLSSTAESSAISGYVIFPELLGESEARAGKNEERIRKKLNLFPIVGLFDAVCNMYFI